MNYTPDEEDRTVISFLQEDCHACLHKRMEQVYLDMRARGVSRSDAAQIAVDMVHFNFYQELAISAKSRAQTQWN